MSTSDILIWKDTTIRNKSSFITAMKISIFLIALIASIFFLTLYTPGNLLLGLPITISLIVLAIFFLYFALCKPLVLKSTKVELPGITKRRVVSIAQVNEIIKIGDGKTVSWLKFILKNGSVRRVGIGSLDSMESVENFLQELRLAFPQIQIRWSYEKRNHPKLNHR